MKNKQYFTIDEANQMIPSLERAFTRITQIYHQVQEYYFRLQDVGFAPYEDEFDVSPPEADAMVADDLTTLKILVTALKEQLDQLHARGCVVKDVATGLVDWYSERDGREVCLCWQLGEKSITHWHETDVGYDGRQPLLCQ